MASDAQRTDQTALETKQADIPPVPKVSIGMPVYNGEPFIYEALDSLLAQSFTDFELIISDNASTDGTKGICQGYAAKDMRIRYMRQTLNIGPQANFRFVLDMAVGEFFMWAAVDDWRSPDFLETNVSLLESAPSLSASTSPNCYKGQENASTMHVNFALHGTRSERYKAFLRNAWLSHGIFYSLMRLEIIAAYKFPAFTYAGFDWSVNMFLLSKGEIHRAKEGLLVLGKHGFSNRGNPWKAVRNKPIEVILPLFEFSLHVLDLMRELTYNETLAISSALIKLNIQASISNFTLSLPSRR